MGGGGMTGLGGQSQAPRIAKRSSRLGKLNRGGPGEANSRVFSLIPAYSHQKLGGGYRSWMIPLTAIPLPGPAGWADPAKSCQIAPLELIPLTFIPLPVSGFRPPFPLAAAQLVRRKWPIFGRLRSRFQSFPIVSDKKLKRFPASGQPPENTGNRGASDRSVFPHTLA
jgi:hypothetical protein